MRNGLHSTIVTLVIAALCGIAQPAASAAPTAVTSTDASFVELGSTLRTDAQYETWINAVIGLRRDFDAICGDTFCEGDYSNIQALRFACSAHSASGRVGSCTWSFAASDEQIDPRSGRISTANKAWRCVLPLAKGTTVEQLLAALDTPNPLYATLPMSTTRVYDALVGCL